MKGFRTVVFNGLMLVVGIFGAEVSPDTAHQFTEAFMLIWGVGNLVLRAITDSPIFKKKL